MCVQIKLALRGYYCRRRRDLFVVVVIVEYTTSISSCHQLACAERCAAFVIVVVTFLFVDSSFLVGSESRMVLLRRSDINRVYYAKNIFFKFLIEFRLTLPISG